MYLASCLYFNSSLYALWTKKKIARETKQSNCMELTQQTACCYVITGYA